MKSLGLLAVFVWQTAAFGHNPSSGIPAVLSAARLKDQAGWDDSLCMVATILVIEDDDIVREMLRITLERSGFRVLVASGGSEALDLCESSATPVDLVLTDIVMPGTSGTDLAGYLALRFPSMRTVRMSGFTEAMLSASGMRRDDSPFLQKPFCREELLTKVRSALRELGS